MPDLTITLTDDEAVQLQAYAARRGLEIPTALQVIVRTAIRRVPADRNTPDYRQKLAGRLARITALVEHIKQHGAPGGKTDRAALADLFGVSLRTIYKDIDVALATIDQEKAVGLLHATDVAPPRPKLRPGPKVHTPRYRQKTGGPVDLVRA